MGDGEGRVREPEHLFAERDREAGVAVDGARHVAGDRGARRRHVERRCGRDDEQRAAGDRSAGRIADREVQFDRACIARLGHERPRAVAIVDDRPAGVGPQGRDGQRIAIGVDEAREEIGAGDRVGGAFGAEGQAGRACADRRLVHMDAEHAEVALIDLHGVQIAAEVVPGRQDQGEVRGVGHVLVGGLDDAQLGGADARQQGRQLGRAIRGGAGRDDYVLLKPNKI